MILHSESKIYYNVNGGQLLPRYYAKISSWCHDVWLLLYVLCPNLYNLILHLVQSVFQGLCNHAARSGGVVMIQGWKRSSIHLIYMTY
jgi:hypothetical protein